MVTPNCCS